MDVWEPNSEHEVVQTRAIREMEEIDNLPVDLRHLVHEYSYATIKAFLDKGLSSAKVIHHLIETVLDEHCPTRGIKVERS